MMCIEHRAQYEAQSKDSINVAYFGSVNKEHTCSSGDTGDSGLIPVSGRFPWRWENWGADSKDLAEGTHVVSGGVRLAFQDWSCCGVFGDRIKLIWGPWGQSRASGIQSGNLGAWEVKGSDKWVLTLEDPWESNKSMAFLPQNTRVVPLSLFLSCLD